MQGNIHGWAMRVILPVCLCAYGCQGTGDGRVQVQGRLTAKGSAVGHAELSFASLSAPEAAVGVTQADGSFTLIGPRSRKKGAFPGTYTVRVMRPMLADGRPLLSVPPADRLAGPAYDAIPAKYSAPGSKGLSVTVPPTGGPLEIAISESLVEQSAPAGKP